ncbi:MAG: hypothetical protein KKF68_03040 [Nanoarchaeota archaeon]|nr:hypothetical protein [Nanoarchaeota archaeon]
MKKKRVVLGLFILTIILLPLILAETIPISPDENPALNSEEGIELNNDRLITPSRNIRDSTNDVFSKEIYIPENVEFFTRILFGLTSREPIEFQTLIILITLWLMFLLILHSMIELISPGSWKSWLGAIILTCLMSITGAVKSMAIFFLNLGSFFSILEQWSPLKIGFGIITIIILFFLLNLILGIIKETIMMGRSVADGLKAGAQLAKLKAMADIEKEVE